MTKLYLKNDPRVDAEEVQQYFYHSDHLGSASLISDYKGDEYQRIEYTPYGETWIERTDNNGVDYLPYRFTGKELDEETGLYYYGARYLDPKYSTWISTDPALGDYIPQAPVNDEARRHNQNLPGMGGIFNHINNNLYHYAGNNPISYSDPDGKKLVGQPTTYSVNESEFTKVGVIAWKNKNKEQEYTDLFNKIFDTSSNIADGKFLLSQVIALAGIGVAKGLSSFSGGLDILLGYIALASYLNFEPEKQKYDDFNNFFWKLQSQLEAKEPLSDFQITFEENLYVEKRTFKYSIDASGHITKSDCDVFVNTVSVTCSYKDKDGNKVESPKITICKKEYNAKDGNNLWRNTFGSSYYNKFLTWWYDLDF